MKKRAGNDDGEIPCNREEREREIERERGKERETSRGRPGWIIAVVSVTVGLFEYLIERKKEEERKRGTKQGRDEDEGEEERNSLAPCYLIR